MGQGTDQLANGRHCNAPTFGALENNRAWSNLPIAQCVVSRSSCGLHFRHNL